MFLIFWKSEPQRSYKHGSYKKKVYRTFGEVSNWDTVSNQLQIVFKSVKYDFLVITTRAMKME